MGSEEALLTLLILLLYNYSASICPELFTASEQQHIPCMSSLLLDLSHTDQKLA